MQVLMVTFSSGACEGDFWENTQLLDIDLLEEGAFKTALLESATSGKSIDVPRLPDVNTDHAVVEPPVFVMGHAQINLVM